LAAACEILDQVTISSFHKVAVIGDGKLGQLIARVLATTGCELILIGKHADKLELAAKAGIKALKVGTEMDGRTFDFVVEASGSASGLQTALDLVKPRGTIILKSTFHAGAVPVDTTRIVVDEISVIGSRCGRFENALKLLEAGKVDVETLIANVYTLQDSVTAMAEAARPGKLKVLLTTDY